MHKNIFTLLISALSLIACAANPPAVLYPVGSLFGIEIGKSLESQFAECPKDGQGEYGFGYHHGATPCWMQRRYGKEVKLPLALLKETGAVIDGDARVSLQDNRVVEIEVFAREGSWQKLKSYMLAHYGEPLEVETYARDSRVIGLSELQLLKWQANGNTQYLNERASNDEVQVRVFNDAWVRQAHD